MSVAESRVRDFYLRFGAALEARDREIFEKQLSCARIIGVDSEHDRFELPKSLGPFGDLSDSTLEGVYADADGKDVNVIIHLVENTISWAERYRDLGDQILTWPPPPAAPLRLARGKPPA